MEYSTKLNAKILNIILLIIGVVISYNLAYSIFGSDSAYEFDDVGYIDCEDKIKNHLKHKEPCTSQTNMTKCRVCWGDKVDIQPCECNDGFHISCFEKWIKVKENGDKDKCEVCLQQYKNIHFESETYYNIVWFVYAFILTTLYSIVFIQTVTAFVYFRNGSESSFTHNDFKFMTTLMIFFNVLVCIVFVITYTEKPKLYLQRMVTIYD